MSDGSRVLRTVYLPNEQVDSLLLTVEALRTQLQQSEQLGRERVAALLEDRRLRIAEERARRSAESERAQEADATLERTEQMLHQYTKDFLSLKHGGRRLPCTFRPLCSSMLMPIPWLNAAAC